MEQTQFDRDAGSRVSQLPEAERLLALLRSDGGGALERAAAQIKAGAVSEAVAQLRPMLDSPQARELLRQLEKQLG